MFDLETEDSGVIAEIGNNLCIHNCIEIIFNLPVSVVPKGHKDIVVGKTLCVLVDSAALVQPYLDEKETTAEPNETGRYIPLLCFTYHVSV